MRRRLLAMGLVVCACTAKEQPESGDTTGTVLRASADSLPVAADRVSGAISVATDWVVADASAGSVSRFDATGRVLWTSGRLGRGPGEYLSVKLLGVRDSGVAIYDNRQRKLGVLSLRDGRTLSETVLRLNPQYFSSDIIAVLASGAPIMRAAMLDYRSRVGAVRPDAALSVGDSIGGTQEVARYRESELIREVVGPRTFELPRPLGRRSGVASCQEKVWVFDGDSLAVLEQSGSAWAKSAVELPSRVSEPATKSELAAWIAEEFPPLAQANDPVAPIIRRYLDTSAPPLWGPGGAGLEPAIQCGPDGAVYLRAFSTGASQRWWRRDARGSWRELVFPDGAEVFAFGASGALARIAHGTDRERVAVVRFD